MANPLDAGIDRLYQLSLAEFTAARNALAKSAGPRGPEIKKLEKPNLAAWAVNQLYWRARDLYDDLLGAAENLRREQRTQLSGKSANVAIAEAKHRGVLQKAKQAVREYLDGVGAASDQVMTSITETLDALPGTEMPGRLTRPLRRVGFGALEGVAIVTPVRKTKVEEAPRREVSKVDQRALAMARERLRFAEAAEREAEAGIERAQRALERAKAVVERISGELDEAKQAAQDFATKLDAAGVALKQAIQERERRLTAVAALEQRRTGYS